jgi:tetratricopeptide (TPR) repeat protein
MSWVIGRKPDVTDWLQATVCDTGEILKMDDLLALAERAAKLNDYGLAEKYCNAHLEQFPTDKTALRLLAFIHALERNFDRAVAIVSDVLVQSGKSVEPSDHFNRGRWLLERGRVADAVADFSTVIELCDEYEEDYLLESAYLYRAIAYMQMGSVSAAKKDLSRVGDQCQTFALGQLVSKASLSVE